MYNVHQDAQLLPLTLRTPDYVYGTDKLPAVSVSASKDKEGLTHVSLVNIDASKSQTLSIDLRGSLYFRLGQDSPARKNPGFQYI